MLAVDFVWLLIVCRASGLACLNTRDANIVIQLGLKRPISFNLLGDRCRHCFWKFDLCSLDENDDCDEKFTNCSGFPDPPTSDFSVWKAVNAQPNLFFTNATATSIVEVRSLRTLGNGSVLAEGLSNTIIDVRQGQVVASDGSKLPLGIAEPPTRKIQLSSISHRVYPNGTEAIAYLDFHDIVHVATRRSRRHAWIYQALSTAGANPALELYNDAIHVLYPQPDLTLIHWTSATGLIPTQLATRGAVSLHSFGSHLVMLLQNVVTAGLDISAFDPRRGRWSFPYSTSQNADMEVTPVFVANHEQHDSPHALFVWDGRLHIMTYRGLGVSPESWMGELACTVGNVPLTKLLIPGTHNSGSYGITADSALGPLSPSNHDLADAFSNPIFSPVARHVARRWSQAQGRSLLDQLRSGIRYFDLRITSGSLASPPIRSQGGPLEDMFFEHVMISIPVIDALSQIKEFLEESPNEFLILDLQHMTGVDGEHRISLYDEIERLFPSQKADWSLSPSEVTLNHMWSNGFQLMVITCENGQRKWLWPRSRSLVSPWPNVAHPEQLKDALERGFSSRQPDLLFVLQGICTEDVSTIVDAFFGVNPQSLRQLASRTSPLILQWLEYWSDMNIILVDWVEDSSLVAACIERNMALNSSNAL